MQEEWTNVTVTLVRTLQTEIGRNLAPNTHIGITLSPLHFHPGNQPPPFESSFLFLLRCQEQGAGAKE